MSFPVFILVPTTSASLGLGDSSEPSMLKVKSLFVPLIQLARQKLKSRPPMEPLHRA
jgi:hypothetical protein